MKKNHLILASLFFALLLPKQSISAQNTIAHDQASNYGSWSGNDGYGFQAWNLWTDGTAGHFIGSSHGGSIDTNGSAFGMWGNPGWSNAQRLFNNPLEPEQEFAIDLSINERNGGRGIDILSSSYENLFNFNVSGITYGSTGWVVQANSYITLRALQIDNNHFQVFLHRHNDNARWTSSILEGRVGGFKAYVGTTGGGGGNDFFINSPRIRSTGRIFLAEGLRMPGDWNNFANTTGMGGDFDLVRTTTGTWRWQTTFQHTGSTGSQDFKFVSTGQSNAWRNQWASNASVEANKIAYFNYGLNDDNLANNTISLTQNSYYTVAFQDRGYTGTRAVFMETSAMPVNINGVSQSPGVVGSSNQVTVTATLSDTPSAQEILYLRYTNDGWNTSTAVEMTGSGTTRSADIPAQANGTQVAYYVFSSTVSVPTADYDMYTLRLNNNGGYNYLYEVGQTAECEDLVLYTTPPFPQEGQAVTIHLNTELGNLGLVDHTGDVYVHTGVITNLSSGNSDWRYVKANWGDDTPETNLTKHSANIYSLTISDIRIYYGVDPSEEILKLVMIFRSENDGSGDYNIHRNADGTDFLVQVYQAGLDVKITSPASQNTLIEANRLITVCAEAKANNDLKIFLNETEVTSVASQSVSTLVSLHGLPDGLHWIVAVANDGSKGEVRDSVSVFIKGPVKVEELPPSISSLARRHMPGVHYHPDNTTVTLVLHDPPGLKNYTFVIGDFNNWKMHQDFLMNVTPDGMYFWKTISGLTPNTEYAYQYFIDNELRLADPYAEKLSDPWNDHWISSYNYPSLKPYPAGKTTDIASVLHPGRPEYNWQVTNFTRPINQDLVIYELHVRDFVESDAIKDVTAKLDYLQDLGVNAIELMPINEFEGNDSWGYNPSFYFAPDKAYGTRFDYKQFIDECHKRGIAVILDIVLNHSFNQSSFVQMYFDEEAGDWGKPTPDNPWFLVDSPPLPWSWGNTFDQDSRFTHDLFHRIVEHWLTEFKVDGYRFDFTKGFSNHPSGGDGWDWDQARIDNLKRIADQVWSASPHAYVILEHLTGNEEETELANYGMMIWGNMEPQYAQATMGWNTGSNLSWGLHTERGYAYHNLISYMESHDEERLMYKNLSNGNSVPGYNVQDLNTALARNELAAVFYFTAPGPKMIWQFGELGYDYSIDYNGRVGRKPIKWDYYEAPARKQLYDIYSAMIQLKTEHPVFRASNITHDLGGYLKRIHLNENTDGSGLKATLLGNFDVVGQNIIPYFQEAGIWYEFFSGNELNVTNTESQIWLEPGEYRLYFSDKVYQEYYSKSTGDLGLTANWGINPDGTGASPTTFTQERAHYHVRNNATLEFGQNTSLSGEFHRLFVGDGNTHNVTLNLDANLTAGTIEVAQGSTLTVKTGNHLVVNERLRNEGTIVVEPGGSITIEGVLSNISGQNSFVLESSATATATMLHETHGVVGKMERHIITDGWHFISAPVEGMNIIGSDFVPNDNPLPTNFDFFFFEENVAHTGANWYPWINVRGADLVPNTARFQQFVPGRGYLASYRSGYPSTNPFAFVGKFGTGEITVPLYHSSTSDDIKGWNLLGNPYPSAIDWNLVDRDLFQDNFAYVYNPSKTGGPGYEAIDGSVANALIAPGQAFFVVVEPSAHGKHLTLDNSLRTHGGTWLKDQPTADKLVLRLEYNGRFDESTIRTMHGSQLERDRTDALKLFSFDQEMPQLFTNSFDGVKLAINSVPKIENDSEIFIGLLAPVSGQYTISIANLKGELANKTIYLKDLQTGQVHNLSLMPTYHFSATNGTFSSRFKLFFDQPTSVPSVYEDNVSAHYWNNYIYVNFANEGQNRHLTVYDTAGKLVLSAELGSHNSHKLSANLSPGVYIARVFEQGNVSTKKLFVRE